MVGVAVEPYTASVGAKGRTLILSFLLEKVVAHEYGVLIVLQRGAIIAYEIATHDDLVEEIPFAVVEQGALAYLVERVVPGVVHILSTLDLTRFALAAKLLGHTLVARIVVHIPHDNYFCSRVALE